MKKLIIGTLGLGIILFFIKKKIEYKDDLDWNDIFKDM